MNTTEYIGATPIEQKSIYDELKKWVLQNYDQQATGYSWRRSAGNYTDCFFDGYYFGVACSAYEVGGILGIDLPEPDRSEDDDD